MPFARRYLEAQRALLKGIYDGRRPGQQILVTGSARLDLQARGSRRSCSGVVEDADLISSCRPQ
jgi:hypothetical protein